MRGNLGVRIFDGRTDRIVTKHISDLQFRKSAPGGHHSLSCKLDMSHRIFPELGSNDPIEVFDTRSGAKIWCGLVENPGPVDGVSGQGYDLSASGGLALTNDMSTPVVFMERSLDDSLWDKGLDTGGTIEVGGTSGTDYKFQFPAGIPVGTNSQVVSIYRGCFRTGQRIYSLGSQIVAGQNNSGYRSEIDVIDEGVAQYLAGYEDFSQTVHTILNNAPTGFPSSCDSVQLRIWRSGGATNVADDLTWTKFLGPYIKPRLAAANGSDAGGDGHQVLAHEVVNHLLGGGALPQFRADSIYGVQSTTTGISQLTYHDGATPAAILDALALYEPDFLWEVRETDDSGKYLFSYRRWPTEVRYEISVQDGFTSANNEVDLCNRVIVYWTDPAGIRRTNISTYSVPALGSRVRDADPITLPPGQSSQSNASIIGNLVLAQKAAAPRSGTAAVQRPIIDRQTGQWVMPWQIMPGYLARVRESQEVYRISETNYTDDSLSTQLTLGNPVRSIEQLLMSLGADVLR